MGVHTTTSETSDGGWDGHDHEEGKLGSGGNTVKICMPVLQCVRHSSTLADEHDGAGQGEVAAAVWMVERLGCVGWRLNRSLRWGGLRVELCGDDGDEVWRGEEPRAKPLARRHRGPAKHWSSDELPGAAKARHGGVGHYRQQHPCQLRAS